LYEELEWTYTYIDELTITILDARLKLVQPKLVCLSVPFPGNLYSAFRCAQFIKDNYPSVKIVMGGGFPNTELRTITDPRVFDFIDFICLDDGEKPIEILLELVQNGKYPFEKELKLKRTFYFDGEEVKYNNLSEDNDYKQRELGTPDYSDLTSRQRYLHHRNSQPNA